MLFIENEGALFRGPARAWPKEVWNGKAFEPYTGAVPKDIEWGTIIDDADASRMMGFAAVDDSGADFGQQEPAELMIHGMPARIFDGYDGDSGREVSDEYIQALLAGAPREIHERIAEVERQRAQEAAASK